MFLIDKYSPKNVSDVVFHKDLYKLLGLISKDDAIPHIIFYGPSGSGKKVMLYNFLEMLFDKTIHDVKDVTYPVTSSGNKTADEIIKQSDYHIVLEPTATNFDRHLIHDVVKIYAKRLSLNVYKTNRNFKLVVINNVDTLSTSAQFSLRRTMEKYSDNCRFIMWCKSLSKVIKPLISRCKCLKVPAPSDHELMKYVLDISIREKIILSANKFTYISDIAKGNIKEALWQLEIFRMNKIIINGIKNSFIKICDIFDIYEIKHHRFESEIKTIKSRENRNNLKGEKLDQLVTHVINEIYKYVIELYTLVTKNIKIINKSLLDPEYFIDNYTKKACKKFIPVKLEKGNKLDINLEIIRDNMEHIKKSIKSLDITPTHHNAVRRLIDLILENDIALMAEMRNIIFNLMITNLKGTEIFKYIIDEVVRRTDITEKKKMDIIKFVGDCEYSLIKGRREIIHFDALNMKMMQIVSSK